MKRAQIKYMMYKLFHSGMLFKCKKIIQNKISGSYVMSDGALGLTVENG